MPRPTSPHPDAERKSASPLHPRNRHLGRYDFPRLIAGSPELERFVILNPYGRQSIDFADPAAVKASTARCCNSSTTYASGIYPMVTCARPFPVAPTTCTTWPTCSAPATMA